MATGITFNGFDLQDANHITEDIDDSKPPERNLGVHTRVRRPGGIITDDTFGNKMIVVTGKILGSGVTDLENRIDTFKQNLALKKKELDIDWASGTRRYIATAMEFPTPRPVRGTNWANFKVTFICTELGKATSQSTLGSTNNNTSSPRTQTITPTGSAPDQYVVIQITLDSFTGASVNTISLKNDDTGQTISISRLWTAGEVLVVDGDSQDVTVDGVSVDFSGAFPVFPPESTPLIYEDDFTARQVDILTKQTPRSL